MRAEDWIEFMKRSRARHRRIFLWMGVIVAILLCALYLGRVKTVSAQERRAEPMDASENPGGGGSPTCTTTDSFTPVVPPAPNYGHLEWLAQTVCAGGDVFWPSVKDYDFGTCTEAWKTVISCSDGSVQTTSGTNGGPVLISEPKWYWQPAPYSVQWNPPGVYEFTMHCVTGACCRISTTPDTVIGTFTVTVVCPFFVVTTTNGSACGQSYGGDFIYRFACADCGPKAMENWWNLETIDWTATQCQSHAWPNPPPITQTDPSPFDCDEISAYFEDSILCGNGTPAFVPPWIPECHQTRNQNIYMWPCQPNADPSSSLGWEASNCLPWPNTQDIHVHADSEISGWTYLIVTTSSGGAEMSCIAARISD